MTSFCTIPLGSFWITNRCIWGKTNTRHNTVRYVYVLKAPYSTKIDSFIIQERFNKLIYSMNTIIKCGTWQPVKFQLVCRFWNEMIFYRISELMLPTLIQRYDKKIIFDLVQKRETNWNFTGCQMPHLMIVLTLYINLLNLSWINNVHFLGIWGFYIAVTLC